MLAAPDDTLRALGGAAAAAVGRRHELVEERLRAALAWLAGGEGRHALPLGHPAYPPQLLQAADPPLLLYVQGRLELLRSRCLAVVGSRKPTPQGADHAHRFAQALAEGGWTVVSGLALGVDAAAHEGALEAGGATLAVMGTGPDLVYPARHRALAHRIAASGALVTEHAPGTPSLPEHFPQRNRIIAGLSEGTLVVEAALRSGSLITARLASEAGREVFAIPGSILSPQSQGCHALIKQGAKLVEHVDDIVEELQPGRARQAELPLAGDSDDSAVDPVLEAMGHDPVTLDALQGRTGWPAADLSARLLELELEGRAARLPGGLYQRRETG